MVHAAGVLRDGVIPLKTKDEVDRVFASKVDGTRVLDEILSDEPLDFFILCSALSTVTGSVAQIDYIASNAYLNAFASERQTRLPSGTNIAICWGTWQQVGMAAKLGEKLINQHETAGATQPTKQRFSWWEKRWSEGQTRYFSTDFSIGKIWMLDEHRIKDGEVLIPGSGYIELVRDAFAEKMKQHVFKEVFFVSPFFVSAEEERTLFLKADTQEGTWEFVFYSQSERGKVEHARGLIEKSDGSSPKQYKIKEIVQKCPNKDSSSHRQDLHLDLGPRWDNIKSLLLGKKEALCRLELPKEFESDLQHQLLHPALLDTATAGAKPLISDFDPENDFHVAFAYGKLQYFAPFEGNLYSYIRYNSEKSSKDGLEVFDISILNTEGNELVRISDFMIKKVERSAIIKEEKNIRSSIETQGHKIGNTVLEQALSQGMTPEEGAEAFLRILNRSGTSQVLVSPIELNVLSRLVYTLHWKMSRRFREPQSNSIQGLN